MKETTWTLRLVSALLALLLALTMGSAHPARAEAPEEAEEQLSLKQFVRKVWSIVGLSDEDDVVDTRAEPPASAASDTGDEEQNILKKGLKGIFSGLKFLTHGMLEELDDLIDMADDYFGVGDIATAF